MAGVDFDGAHAFEGGFDDEVEGLLGIVPGAGEDELGVALVAVHGGERNGVGQGGAALEGDFDVDGHGHGTAALEAHSGQGAVVGPDAVDSDVGVLGGVDPLVVVPVEDEAGFALGDAHEVFGTRMLEAPLVEVAAHRAPEGIVADDSAQLNKVERAHHVGRHLVRKLAVKVVGRSAGGLAPGGFGGALGKGAEVALVRIRLVGARDDVHDLVFGEAGEALVHPVVALLVGGQHSVEPHVGALVGYDAKGSEVVVAVGLHQRTHGVLHGALSALNDAELGPAVGSEVLVHKGEVGSDVGAEAVVLVHHARLFVGLVEVVDFGSGGQREALVAVFAVGGPGEVVHVVGRKAPGDARFFLVLDRRVGVSVADFGGVLKDAGSAQYEASIGGHVDLETAKVSIEFAGHVEVGVPAVAVVDAHFGVPLREAVVDSLFIAAACALDDDGNTGGVLELEHVGGSGGDGLVESGVQDGLVDIKGQVTPVVGDATHDLLALFVGFEVLDSSSDGLVLELGRNVGHVAHHASGLKGVPVEVHEDFVEGVGAVVGVFQSHFALEAVLVVVEIDVDFIADGLLPVGCCGGLCRGLRGGLRGGGTGSEHRHGQRVKDELLHVVKLEFLDFGEARALFGLREDGDFVERIVLEKEQVLAFGGFVEDAGLFFEGQQRPGVVAHHVGQRNMARGRQKVSHVHQGLAAVVEDGAHLGIGVAVDYEGVESKGGRDSGGVALDEVELAGFLQGHDVFAQEAGFFARIGVGGPVPMACVGPVAGVGKGRPELVAVARHGSAHVVKVQMRQKHVGDVVAVKPVCGQTAVEGRIAVQVVVAEEFFVLLGADSGVD